LNLFACKLLADENIHPAVVNYLRQQSCDVYDVHELSLAGAADDAVLRHAVNDQRVVLTHDRDFGRLAILARQPISGIAFLRPGHIDPGFTIATLQAINVLDLDLSGAFILVAVRRGNHLRVRLRSW
jgi:predicted nuclease of predicted toxin-antitoxin system